VHYNARMMARAAFAALILASSALAQTQRSGSGGELQKFMQQYQQIAAERSALQAQVAQMKRDLDTGKAELAAMKKERDALKSRSEGSVAAVAQANASKQQTEQNLEQYKQRMNELVARFRETAQNLKSVEADRNTARQELTERNAAFDTCADKNLQLYEINGEILNRYEHVGMFTKASALEPFTQLTRTRLENLVDDYRGRAQELRVKKNQDRPAPSR
jgi:chromosome segregation ATPase